MGGERERMHRRWMGGREGGREEGREGERRIKFIDFVNLSLQWIVVESMVKLSSGSRTLAGQLRIINLVSQSFAQIIILFEVPLNCVGVRWGI